ncbi:MAG: hypothetical protein LQ343_004963 [Gyalolechia ehrenbergii]|nr:MAG: hypothetical protein LQ343_004963 [Gyalolechia ehrenbergii]
MTDLLRHENRKFNAAPQSVEQGPKPPAPLLPNPASSASKSKLKVMKFNDTPEQDSEQEIGEENKPRADNTTIMAASQLIPGPPTLSQPSQHKECPQTPLGRLPLAELIADVHDNANQNLDLTPIERVLWHHVPGSSQLSSSQPASTSKQGQKRARSSSPASSSQNEASTHFPNKKRSFHLETLQKTVETPQADPADDLWTRYTVKTGGGRDGLPTRNESIFAELLRSSSPPTPGSHLKTREVGSLRRSNSCANEWPTSAAKRRRLNNIGSQIQTLDDRQSIEKTENAKRSRVSLLVEQVQNALLRSRAEKVEANQHHESSPSPGNGAMVHHSQSSPAHNVHVDGDQKLERPSSRYSSSAPGADLQALQNDCLRTPEKTSEFGDDDFDDDELLEVVHASLVPEQPTDTRVANNVGLTPWIQTSEETIPASSKPPAPLKLKPEPTISKYGSGRLDSAAGRSQAPDVSKKCPSLHDDFEEDDDDMSAADLETLVAVYDQQPQAPPRRGQQASIPQSIARKPLSERDGANTSRTSIKTLAAPKAAKVIDVSSDEEFGDDADFDDIVAQCEVASQPAAQSVSRRQRYVIQRYQIINIVEGEYLTDRGRSQPEKALVVQSERTKLNKMITLRQSWVRSPCLPGSYVHLVGKFDNTGQCIIDDRQNLLIIHPDHLVSATVVGDSFSCIRRAVLQDRVKATNDTSEAQIYGHILHEIFQEAMKANRWDDGWLHKVVENIVSYYLESFFEINVDPLNAIEQLKGKTAALQSWAETFVAAKPKSQAMIKDRNGTTSILSVNKLLEVEEKVWSPMYGLKGNVDASVQITTKDGSGEKVLTVPFELKTGKRANAAHKAQTALYTLLLSDRYDIDVACGILYYMDSAEISRVPAIRHELMHMVMQRNELASYIRQRTQLPPMLKSAHLCGRCYAQTSCFVYHRLTEDGDGETSGMKEKFDEVIRHLNPSHAAFFKKWDDLLTKEERDMVKIKRELWTMQSVEREKVGRCFSNVTIERGSAKEIEDAPKINRYHYTFVKQKSTPGFSFLESQITTGEPIVISDEKGHFALANGYVTAIRKRKVEVAVDRRLSNARNRKERFHSQHHQSFVGIMEVLEGGSTDVTVTPEQAQEPISYRIDKDEFSNGMATVRNNLISLMDKSVFGSQALRKLIVENAAPTFRPRASEYSLGDSASQASLNVDQRNAVEKILSTKDYALVLGMPGTGKTTTIAHLIRALTAQGKSVLLASYTHTAVDNILLKIRNDNIGVFRLGALAKVHPDVQDFADLAGTPMKSIEEIKTAYSRPVVATTCLGINHAIFNQKLFDYCIVDEASQITLPVCLGPIRMARTFILVGDHNQLPPLVQNKEAQEGGLDVSLFKMLSDSHPESVVNLEHQYRMCEDIMTLSNTLIYNGQLKCGNAAVAQRSIRVPRMEALKQHHHTPSSLLSANLNPKTVCLNPTRFHCWLRDLLDPGVKACFVNTDTLLPLSREAETGSRLVNTCEATLCTHLVQSLLTTGVPAKDIGVITLYRSQLALIKQNLRQFHPAVEMHTADKFQGRDKEVVILSLVRNNESLNVGDLLKDWRRVNVALTRARTKLLILGSKSTLKGNELLDRFIRLMDEKGWIYNLPPGAMEGHVFEDGATPSLTARFSSHETKAEKAEVKREPLKRKRINPFSDNKRSKDKENKVPMKTGKVSEKVLLGSRPVLRDIVNDAS